MYDTKAYGSMIGDTVRMRAYTGALRASIKPGDIVVDIGTGTGIFALLACQYGASHVYAIDPNENIHVAKKLAKDNGYSDRIEFIQDISPKVSLTEKADVIISDLRGLLPLYQKHILSLADARKRLLKPNGSLIPKQDTLYVCVVENPEQYKEYSDPWVIHSYNLHLDRARELSLNSWSKGKASVEQMLTKPHPWAVLNYRELENPHVQGKVTQRFLRNGLAHGLLVWFDAELTNGIGFSNAPDCKEHAEVYGRAFFPFLQPVEVSENDEACIELKAILVNDDYAWCWNTQITSGENIKKADFQQSTFYGTIFSLDTLRKRQPSYVPRLNSNGLIEQCIQQEMNGINSLETIAQKLMDRFPDQFSSLQEALERAGDSVQKYGN